MVATRSAAAAQGGKLKALVTGGVGFLGTHLVSQLLATGQYDVTIFDIRDPGNAKAPVVVGDLRKYESVLAATKGMDVVFHCATAAPTGENSLNIALMHDVNVKGTEHMIRACRQNGVKYLVYTSSASVVFMGRPLVLVDEDTPYAAKPMDYYTKTKILGEQAILAANSPDLSTVALRPSGIFGEGDPIFVPTLVKQARGGKMKYIIGSGANMMDFTYVGNVAQAHIDAATALMGPAADKVAGKAYFITNQDPRPFWGMMGDVCEGLGYSRPRIHLPFLLIILVAALFEYVIRPLVAPFKTLNTDFTVNRILIATTNRTFSSQRAQRDFGYRPKVSMQEAMKRTLLSFGHLRNEKVPGTVAAAKKAE